MDILSQLFQFGIKLEYKGDTYYAISQVGFSNEQKVFFWLAVKNIDKFPCQVYLIPQEYSQKVKNKLHKGK